MYCNFYMIDMNMCYFCFLFWEIYVECFFYGLVVRYLYKLKCYYLNLNFSCSYNI